MKKRRPIKLFIFIIILAIVALWVDFPGLPVHLRIGKFQINQIPASKINLNIFGLAWQRDFPIKQGLDLAGGTHVVLQVDTSKVASADRQQALDSDTEVIRRRINLFGTNEPIIQSSQVGNDYRIIVDLPGVKDADQAVALVGKTAQLELREIVDPALPPIYPNTKPTGLTGADFVSAQANPVSQSSTQASTGYQVDFSLTDDGGKKFDELTKRLSGKEIPIFLDGQLISSPVVNGEISGGKGTISGNFTASAAKELATQLNAGALKAPVHVAQQTTISPILGSQPIQRSLIAGALGLIIIALFLILYYGRLGLVATAALGIYALLTLAIFKIIPITLTLAGIAGFILSVGMAVDANILIFERMKEELNSGKSRDIATELGFKRAWTSIRDSNIVTIATSLILYYTTTDLVRGFALTLLIGVLVSMFTAIVVTRTILRIFLKYG
jgi:preprotein translocase subunit SecD